jgi:cytochrome c556
MKRNICLIAMLLWLMTLAVGAWLFVRGWTRPGSDGRTEILLAPAERDQILAEMRLLLKTVDGILRGLGDAEIDRRVLAMIAREAGMGMAADVEPTIMAKLPLPFKQLGMSIHKDMDALADAIAEGATTQEIVRRLSDMTARCTACHEMYRLGESR